MWRGYKLAMAKNVDQPRQWPGVVALVVCCALWSLNGPLIKLLNEQQVPGVTVACYRSLIGGLVFLPLVWGRRGVLRQVPAAWPIGSVLMFTLMTVSFVISTMMTTAANAIILQNTSAIWVFLLAPLLLKERPGRTEGLVLLVAMAGIAVIFFGGRETGLAGLVIALVSGFGYGALIVALRGLRSINALVVAAMNALGSGLLLVVPTLIWGTVVLTPRGWALVLTLSLVQFTLPYVLFSWGLQRVEAHKAALIVLLETVLNPIWTFLLVGERVGTPTLIGGPLILLGVAGWLILSWRRASRAAVVVPAGA
jgi:drug/metabolite transporter, DME family